jgi:hypothetical protein
MTAAVFGFLDNAKEALTEFVNNCLLVAGGFLIGYILGGVLGWAFGKWVLRQQAPDTTKRVGRPVGGAILAIIVALIVFTGKGKGPGSGGDGKGSTDADSANKAKQQPVDPNVLPKIPVVKPVDSKPADVTIRVTVLGGEDVQGDKFYLIDDDATPKTFTELKDALTARKGKEKGRVAVAILFPTRNALPRDHPAVTRVARWVNEEAGMDVTFPAGSKG